MFSPTCTAQYSVQSQSNHNLLCIRLGLETSFGFVTLDLNIALYILQSNTVVLVLLCKNWDEGSTKGHSLRRGCYARAGAG